MPFVSIKYVKENIAADPAGKQARIADRVAQAVSDEMGIAKDDVWVAFEGIAAAEYLLGLGAKRVLVVAAVDDTQQRAVSSLRERLVARGATVTDVAGEGTSDFIPFAQKEGGVDAVFLAVKGSSARLLMPKLALARRPCREQV